MDQTSAHAGQGKVTEERFDSIEFKAAWLTGAGPRGPAGSGTAVAQSQRVPQFSLSTLVSTQLPS